MIARTLALLSVLFCIALPAAAAQFPVPPVPQTFVTDNAGALSQSTRSSLDAELRAYERTTGHQIIVWIGQTTGNVPLETWTGETADAWKVGRKSYDDGAVLFVFMRDRKVRIEVGYGLEGRLTDADSYRIISQDILPRMRQGDPNGAVSSGVAGMLAVVSPSYRPASGGVAAAQPASASPAATWPPGASFALLLLVLVLVVIVVQVSRAARYGHRVAGKGGGSSGCGAGIPWFLMGMGMGGGFGGGGFGGGGFGGFSAGGGSFGGGGASGGW